MREINIFLIERLLCLFWLFVQQLCFGCIKYAYEDIAGRGGNMRWELVRQAALLLAAALLAFIRDIFPMWTERLLVVGGRDYFPWGVRISLCAAMVLFDSLLVLYFSRIVRLYRKGLSAARPTLPGDALLCSLVAVTAAGYIWLSLSAASRFGLSMEEYMWIGRFFVQLCNFSYIALEALGALLFLLFLRRLRSDAP